MGDLRFALLIDADNVSSKYIRGILDEMTSHGITTYRRIYGDWTSPQQNKWREKLLENSIMPIQQFSNTFGKNATDSALIIDAMDILYTKNVDGFCIVSSDSDFTRLASRLRESGMMVIGMGEEKTPQSFRTACTIFTNLENLYDDDDAQEKEAQIEHPEDSEPVKTTQDVVLHSITDLLIENEEMGLAELGNRLVKKYPDFDVRNFGYNSLSKFLEEIEAFELHKTDKVVTITLKSDEQIKEKMVAFILQSIEKRGKRGIGIAELSNEIRNQYADFSVKQYGYSQLSKFVQSIDGVEIYEGAGKRKRAKRK